ncbi:WXG100 family type VII secretion target, partial [Kitasatospora sp. MBT66]
MPDYNGHGFHQGDDGAVFGTTDGSATGSEGDYDLWDWKQIMAAVSGMSAGVGDDANLSHARSVSDPRSLQDAANTYYRVQKSLEAVAKSLVDQAKALAGEDGPWKGPAADSFLDTMTTFSRQVAANAKVLSGGSTGRHSVPQQLANNAVTLRNARLKLAEIDTWYADRAQQLGLTPMSNGLIPISQKPELVRNMTEDMRTVLKSLASHYRFTSDTIVSPQPVPSPVNTPDEHQGPGGDGPGGGPGPLPDPQGVGGDLPGGGDLASLAAGPGLDGLGAPGDLGAGPGGADGLDDLAGLGGPGGLSELGGAGGLDGAGLPDLPGLSFPGGLGLGPGGLAALDPGTYPGLADLGGHGGLDKLGGLDGTDFGGLPTLGTLGALGLGGLAGLGGPGVVGKGLTTGRGTASGLAGFPRGLGLGGRADRTGEEAAGEELQDGAGTATGLPVGAATESGLPTGMGGAGMPFMPGMGGGAPAGRGDGSGERSDASGLLTPSTEPWEAGAASGEPEAGSAAGAAAGGEGLTAGGVPLLPAAGVAGTAGRTVEK